MELATVLPTQSVCLVVPVIRPQEYRENWAVRRREAAATFRRIKNPLSPDDIGAPAPAAG